MSLLNSTADRLRRANQLWHAYLASTGLRFDLAQFLKEPALEKQILDARWPAATRSSSPWRRTGCVTPGRPCPRWSPRVVPPAAAPADPACADRSASSRPRYLRGVR